MHWDDLPPRRIEDCPHRSAGSAGAACDVLRQTGLPLAACGVSADVCSACLKQFPPRPDCWNTVIASLVYSRADEAADPKLAQLRRQAVLQLDAGPGPESAAEAGTFASLRELLPWPRRTWGRRVKSWAVGAVSAPRRQPTLEATVNALRRAGWNEPFLFLDGTVRVPAGLAHLPGVLREPAAGCWPNYYLALSELLMRFPEADAVLLMEDDALLCDDPSLREYLEQMLWPRSRRCIVSLYCPGPYTAARFGWRPSPRRWTLGALALVFPRGIARRLVRDAKVAGHRWDGHGESHRGLSNTDIVIGTWAWRRRVPIWAPTPSLVQHVGDSSTLRADLQATADRRAALWAGQFLKQARQ